MKATRFVMDYLRHGPTSLEDMCFEAWAAHRLTREQVSTAASSLGVRCRQADYGSWLAFLPYNLVAIWWAKGRTHAHRFSPRNLSNAYQRVSASGTASAEGSA